MATIINIENYIAKLTENYLLADSVQEWIESKTLLK